MKFRALSLLLAIGMSVSAAGAAGDGASAPATQQALTIDPIDLPAALQAQVNAATVGQISSITPWQVIPIGTPAEVFSSPDIFFTLLDLDAQLPWALRGEVNPQALPGLLGSNAGLVNQISQFADPSGQGYRLGAYKWSHPTAPDFCSGETVYLMYFPHTGVLFAFRFDSSSEC